MKKILLLALAGLIVLAAQAATGLLAGQAAAGTLTGKVSFSGKMRKARKIKMGDDDYCRNFYKGKAAPRSKKLVVSPNGEVRWAFVYLQAGVKGKSKPPKTPATITQKGCQYATRVVGMVAGQRLVINNGDQTKHNFHLLGRNKYNRSASPGQSIERKVRKAAKLKLRRGKSRVMSSVKCDIHPWMKAYLAVMPHSYFSVTGPGGRFEIKNVPDGEYTLAVWHEKLGTMTQKVTVSGGAMQSVDFAFSK
ncbi:MAG: hypothetical protein IIC13_04025 [SAR324 cluster bacterium]|nr:hypothetical protein [SAR324 cluster bacterium]